MTPENTPSLSPLDVSNEIAFQIDMSRESLSSPTWRSKSPVVLPLPRVSNTPYTRRAQDSFRWEWDAESFEVKISNIFFHSRGLMVSGDSAVFQVDGDLFICAELTFDVADGTVSAVSLVKAETLEEAISAKEDLADGRARVPVYKVTAAGACFKILEDYVHGPSFELGAFLRGDSDGDDSGQHSIETKTGALQIYGFDSDETGPGILSLLSVETKNKSSDLVAAGDSDHVFLLGQRVTGGVRSVIRIPFDGSEVPEELSPCEDHPEGGDSVPADEDDEGPHADDGGGVFVGGGFDDYGSGGATDGCGDQCDL